MGDRVLNFSEFADKYSVDGDNELNVNDMSAASDNFTDGFDQDSYDSPEIKANHPVGMEDSLTPPGPGEEGAPAFDAEAESGMEAPGEEEEVVLGGGEEELPQEEPIEEPVEEIPSDIAPEEGEEGEQVAPEAIAPSAPPVEAGEDGGDPEEGDEDDDDDDEEEEANESVQGLLESFDDFTSRTINEQELALPQATSHQPDIQTAAIELEGEEFGEDEGCYVFCQSCGAKKEIEEGEFPMGLDKQMDNSSWWKGKEGGGMQCGCK